MFSSPRFLQLFVIEVNILSFVSQFAEVAGIEAAIAEQTSCAHCQLLFIRPIFQTCVLSIEPRKKLGIVCVQNKKFHYQVSAMPVYCRSGTHMAKLRYIKRLLDHLGN